ncbi:MAG: ComEC family competence protein [Schlesneria sp.]|nr:ComEC family competence protein [Schlesneria sp.]
MFHPIEPATDAYESDQFRRSPAVPVVCAVAIGILLDHLLAISFLDWWIGSAIALTLVPLAWSRRWNHLAVSMLLLACLGLGGVWHHWRWNCLPDDEVSHWATETGCLVRVFAKVVNAPTVLVAIDDHAPWKPPERTLVMLECRRLVGDSSPAVSGYVRLSVAGRLDQLAIGDLVEVSGLLLLPSEPSNPGDFDTRRWLRTQGLHATLAANQPEAVVVVSRERTSWDWLTIGRTAVRHRAENLIATRLRASNVAVAQSLLLGSRVELDRDLRRAFAESGTLHILAISGMNVGLLWIAISFMCRLFRLPPEASALTALILLPAYALITDANPPVVRATIVAVVMVLGQLIGRTANHWNSLAVAALIVLVWNPSDLFNAGAQLSFIAVATILITMRFLKSFRATDLLDVWSGDPQTILRQLTHRLMRSLFEGFAISLAIWVTTSPLIASQFHLISPIGVVFTVLLNVPIGIMFCLGYAFLFLGLISPTLFGWLGVPFDFLLGWFLSAVETASRIDLGHIYAPSPPLWWMIGFYVLVPTLVIWDHRKGRLFWSVRATLVWTILGLAISLRPANGTELTCTVLSVGHGLSVLVECPNGQTLLYDAGSMTGGGRAARTIETTLWASGHARLDAVVLSHPDADHCNALPELVDVVPIRTLLCHRSFLDWSQPPVAAALDDSAKVGINIKLISADQQILLDPNVTFKVLHPAPDFTGKSDNANSVVLCLEYAGRRILFTGDLEHDGLHRLLKEPAVDTDILLSPHHGSTAANSSDLARWATPEWLLVSYRDDSVQDRLANVYGPATQVMTTARYGAIRCRIKANGELLIEPFKRRTASPTEIRRR